MIQGSEPRRSVWDVSFGFLPGALIYGVVAASQVSNGNDRQAIGWALLCAGFVLLGVTPHLTWASLKRGVTVLTYAALIFSTTALIGSDNRRLAPVLNRVLPHVKMDVTQTWTITRGNEGALQAGHIQVFNVTLDSYGARGVEVDSYDFELEAGGTRYRDALDDMTGSCDAQQLPLGGALSCRVAFAVPKDAVGGTLVFDGRNYTAWTDVAF